MNSYPRSNVVPGSRNFNEQCQFGFVRMKPDNSGVITDGETVRVFHSTGFYNDEGLYVVRTTQRVFKPQPNGDLIFVSADEDDEFYKEYLKKGFKLYAYGQFGVILQLIENSSLRDILK